MAVTSGPSSRGPTPVASETEDPTDIVVVSDRTFIGQGLTELLMTQPTVGRCLASSNSDELRAAVKASVRTVILVDLDQPGLEMEELGELFLEGAPEIRRIGFFDAFTARHAEAAFALSVTVLLPLGSPVEHIPGAVLGDRLTSSSTTAEGLTRDEFARLGSLTAREVEVLQHVAEGLPVRAVAALLGITAHTVETHKRRAFRKLGVQHDAHAIAMAVSAGLVTPD